MGLCFYVFYTRFFLPRPLGHLPGMSNYSVEQAGEAAGLPAHILAQPLGAVGLDPIPRATLQYSMRLSRAVYANPADSLASPFISDS